MVNRISGMIALLATLLVSCNKDDKDDSPKELTKSELLTTGSWKFDKFTASGIHLALGCYHDNTITFSPNTATIAEGANQCTPPSPSTPFNWSFKSNQTQLSTATPIFTGGSTEFTIVTLTETSLVLTQNWAVPPSPDPVPVEITLKH